MSQFVSPDRRPLPADSRSRSGIRRLLALPIVGLLATLVLMLAPGLASADSASTLTVVGTSDVSDSGLIPNLIQPEFHAAFPQFVFKYVGTASGTAVVDAENGSQGASVLIVHAPSLENQFVAGGFSFEPFGRAIWTNDFVLAGPSSDPAGVGTDGAHDIVRAFADVAREGMIGGATPSASFISRGGTPGTTVAEHQIWALVDSSGLEPLGLTLCTVGAKTGGGETPINTGTNGAPCPGTDSPAPTQASNLLPPWYQATAVTQGPNVVAANACTSAPATPGTCYVFTDRGTFDYLASGGTPIGGASTVPALTILTRDNSASAPGGADELINYFHAYVINPATSPSPINLTAAQDFVNFITSPTVQSQLSSYLNDTNDPGGPPFVATASPTLTATGFPSSIAAGKTVTVTGSVVNKEPDFPALAGKTVSVDELAGLVPVAVASGTTDANGNYSITFAPPSSGSYQVSTGQIQQVENSTLNPVFGDILSPASTSATPVQVNGTVAITKATASANAIQASGTVGPAAPDGNATVRLMGRKKGSTGAFTQVGQQTLTSGAKTFAINGNVTSGAWQIEAVYGDGSLLGSATSGTQNVTVPSTTATVGFKKLTVKKGKLTLSGTLSEAPVTKGAKVELFALQAAALTRMGKKASSGFKQVAHATIGAGKKTYTIKHTFKRGFVYVLQLEYVHKGQTSSFSKLRTITIR
jgi:ABC-type tungstate transport system permease subunit